MPRVGTSSFTDVDNTARFLAGLQRGIRRGLDDLGDRTLDQIDTGFAQGTDAMGNEWEPLSPRTIEMKGHGKILIEHGDLRSSFEASVRPFKGQLSIHSADPKLPLHEFGAPDEGIPRRPVLSPAADWIAEEGFDRAFLPALKRATAAAVISSATIR